MTPTSSPLSIVFRWLPSGAKEMELCPCGSPDRTIQRSVWADAREPEAKYVLETVPTERGPLRRHQAEVLQELARAGCPCLSPWLPDGEGIISYENASGVWQLRKYIDGEELPRDCYADQAWRGTAAAEFLLQLRQAASKCHHHCHPFSLGHYLLTLLPKIQETNASLYKDISAIMPHFSALLKAETSLTTAFCHGDFHPGNIIWGKDKINGIIDWEFHGPKYALYDVANMLGCLGNDSPENLTGPMALALLEKLQDSPEFATETDWYWLPDYLAALRLAWMREWWHRNQREMMIQELDFIWLILDNRDFLRHRWTNR